MNRIYGRGPSQVHAVRDVSLAVYPGDRLGIVGESGSGKSTLIRMMAALDRPTSGQIRFRGTDIGPLPERQLGDLRSSVQMVFQDPRSSLNPRMKVGEIITEGLRSPLLRQRDDVPVNHDARLREVMDQVGLPVDKADSYPHEFSGGQRQRIAIARALAPKPDVLIADEPVSALDVSVRAHVLNLLRDLVAEYALTMVFVSHDLTVVRHVCDQVVVMRHGAVVEAGGIASVYADPQHDYTRELLAAVPRFR
ncbi:ATP-binding cassette domain-containing protein [Luteococcus sp. H138]|uniref:ABC transporter ATP-binding protein n=1 Tax=unclassified Luteococcus TaxID=2639923 RepID=UPI00313BEF9E